MKLMFESVRQPTLRLQATFRGRPPWLSALLAGALAISSGCSAESSEAPTWSEFLAASTSSFEGQAIYVVDGDLAVSLDELRAEYERLYGPSSDLGVASQASTVNRLGDADDLWSASAAKNLRYCVSNEFGALKARAVSEMAEATWDWEATGQVDFQYVESEDGNCTGSNPNVVFAVRPWTGNNGAIACAFFPSGGGCVSRTIVIDYNAYLGAWTTTGVYRHELGHVLGLRHEHIRAPGPACTSETAAGSRAVTAYDSASVMFYSWCPGGTNTGDLRITDLDAAGMGALYPRPFQRVLTAWDWGGGWSGYTLHVVDVSGDGRADLIWNELGSINRTYVALANGDGTFTRMPYAWDQPEGGWSGYTLHVADVSGDGRADLIWNSLGSTNRTYVALANGNGTFTRVPGYWDQGGGWSGYTLHVADVSGDGRADLIWSSLGYTNRTYVALAAGDGTFSALTAWDQPEGGWSGYTLHVADVSGDGRADLIWSSLGYTNRTYVALANGNGTFTRALSGWDQPEGSWSDYTLHVGDVSGDGRADLVWSSLGYTNRTYVALANGDGTFTRALTAWAQPESSWSDYTLHIGDVSGDGRADLIWSSLGTTNRTYVALSNGNGTFKRDITAWAQPEGSWSGYSLHVADITGDGKSDLVWNTVATTNRTYTAVSLY